MKNKKCKNEDCKSTKIWSKGFCRFHFLQEYPPTPLAKVTERSKIKSIEKAEKTKELHKWFLELWDKRCDESGNCKCFECGKLLKREQYRENSACYSHILPKSKYEEIAMLEENTQIVHPNCHALYESYPPKAKNQYELRLKLKQVYG